MYGQVRSCDVMFGKARKINKMKRLIQINEVKVEEGTYPRTHVDWITCARYYNALKSGAKFPPIIVAQIDKEYFLIDGAHRLKAFKDNKETHIQAEIIKNLNKEQIYLEAVKYNINHGRQFSTQEVTQICITLEKWNLSKEQISEIVRIPADNITSFVAKRMTRITETQEEIALKAPLRNLSEFDVGIGFNQKRISGTSQVQLLEGVIKLIQNNWIDLENKIVMKKLNEIKKLLEDYIK